MRERTFSAVFRFHVVYQHPVCSEPRPSHSQCFLAGLGSNPLRSGKTSRRNTHPHQPVMKITGDNDWSPTDAVQAIHPRHAHIPEYQAVRIVDDLNSKTLRPRKQIRSAGEPDRPD